MKLFGGVEAGGTKFVCALGSGPDDIRAETRFSTTTPDETLAQVVDFFRSHQDKWPIAALGVAAFGPIDLDPRSSSYGQITSTPKPGWAGTDIAGILQAEFQMPVGLDTDVNGAALGEQRWGAGQGIDPLLYITIGTGIGGGCILNSAPMHGLVHPEMGHILIPHDRDQDPFPGVCPFHGDCFEGLASGPALQKRWKQPGETLPPEHPAWKLEAHYIALALANLILILSPRRIVLGGGVMKNLSLFPLIREKALEHLNGYVQSPELQQRLNQYIVPPLLGSQAGVLGSIALAEKAFLSDGEPF
jgi:fructokinase